MRKLLLALFSVVVFAAFAAPAAVAQEEGGGPCEGPAAERNPHCGDNQPPACDGPAAERNPLCGIRELPACDGPAGERNPICTGTLPPGGGGDDGNGEEPQPPAGACEGADLVLVPDVATLVCLFQPGNENATEANCPGGIFLGGPDTGAICILPNAGLPAPPARR